MHDLSYAPGGKHGRLVSRFDVVGQRERWRQDVPRAAAQSDGRRRTGKVESQSGGREFAGPLVRSRVSEPNRLGRIQFTVETDAICRLSWPWLVVSASL